MKICPRVSGRLLRAAMTSPNFWSMGGPPSPPTAGSATDAQLAQDQTNCILEI